MVGFITWTYLALSAAVVCVAVIFAVRKPMSEVLRANSYIAPAGRFYLRSFSLIIFLTTLGAVIAAGGPCKEQSKNFIERVWWIADNLESVIWGAILCLGGYALLLTILFAALGRYHDK